MTELLKVNNLCYKDFRNINLSFNSGNFYYIVGGNNSGKTTLFRILSGLIITNNVIDCDGVLLNAKSRYNYIKKVGVVERVNKYSFNFINIIDELMYPLINLGYSKSNSIKKIKSVLNFFEVDEYLNKKISELNIYEKQELLIIISLLHSPKVLLIDSVLDIFPSHYKTKIIGFNKTQYFL